MNRDFKKAEESVAKYLKNNDYINVEILPSGFPFIDITAEKDGKRFAFQIKNKATATAKGILEKFCSEFIETKEAKTYKDIFYISRSGFGKSVYSNFQIGTFHKKLKIGFWIEDDKNEEIIYIAGIDEKRDKEIYESFFDTKDEGSEYDGLTWEFQKFVLGTGIKPPPPQIDPLKIAVCTLKGGVGKTTVSVNLAGSLAKKGLDISLVDCDPQQYTLLRLFAPEAIEGDVEAIEIGNHLISCYSSEYWEKSVLPQIKTNNGINCGDIVVYDCPPKLDDKNPWWKWIFQNADICLVPVSICPVGLGKAGFKEGEIKEFSVIHQTVEAIKKINPNIHILVIENNKMKTKENKNVQALRESLKFALKKLKTNIYLIEPFIRHSDKIYYWGFEKHKLPIDNTVGGQSIPDQDFEQLAEYILRYFQIITKKNTLRNQSQNLQNVYSDLENTKTE